MPCLCIFNNKLQKGTESWKLYEETWICGTREGGRGSWVLQSWRATPPQSFSLLLPKVQRPGVTPRHSCDPPRRAPPPRAAGELPTLCPPICYQAKHPPHISKRKLLEKIGFPDCCVQNSSGTVTMVGKHPSSRGVVARQVVANPTSLTNLIS